MDMPLEIELLITAWDNAKKNTAWAIDSETGEIIAGDMPADLGDLLTDINDRMLDLVEYYRNPSVDGFFGADFEDDDLALEDEEVPFMF